MSSYNPRVGGIQGRVGKDDFSIDGKSWEYRNPSNFNDSVSDGASKRDNDFNRHASDLTNPLYDYSYGQVRDAAKTLGIGNVNSQDEVSRLISQIQNPPSSEPETVKAKKPKKESAPTATAAPVKTVLSKEAAEANAFVDAHNAMTLGNTSPLQGMSVSNKAGTNPKAADFKESFQMQLGGQLNLGGTGTPLSFTEAITGTKPTAAAPLMSKFKENIKGQLEPK